MKKILIFAVVAVILPLTLNFAAYFGFISGYTSNTFSENSFKNQYDNDIYKYRVLSNISINKLNHILEKGHYKSNYNKMTRQLQFLDKDASVPFYLAYFIWNTLFLILSSISFYFLLLKILKLDIITIIISSIILNFLIIFTQFVVVPYDNFSYFFEILFIIAVFDFNFNTTVPIKAGDKKSPVLKTSHADRVWLWWLILPLIMIISTLNRESSAVNLSFLGAILFYNHKYNFKKWFIILFPSFLAFLISYLGIRFYLGFEGSALQTETLIGNIKSIYNLIGLVFWLSTTFIIFMTGNSISEKVNKYFLIFAIPYILSCFISGILFEFRLWVPILIAMIVINLKYRK
jgi:hypothetical protein